MVTQASQRLTTEISNQVKRYIQNMKDNHVDFDTVLVFGSQAKQQQKAWSDIDICVVSKQFGKNRYDERIKLLKLTDSKTVSIEPHPYNPQDLDNPWDPLAVEIKKYGIEID